MRDTLLIFSQSFPFGDGEPFLGHELPYVAERFARVLLVPQTRPEGSPRVLPANVELDDGLARLGGLPRPTASVLRATLLDAKSFALQLERRRVRGLRRWARFARVLTHVEKFLEARQLDPRRSLFYSYWLEAVASALGTLRARSPDLRAVARAHRWDLYEDLHDPPWFPFRRAALQGLEAIYAVSGHGASHLRQRYPELREKVCVARLGVEPLSRNPESSDGVFRVLSCSSISPVKRVDLIARSVRRLAAAHPSRPIAWTHFGGGPLEAQLREVTASVPPNLTVVLRGRVPNAVVREHLQTQPVDVFVNVSESEGVPVSIMEAQAAALPIIATDVGGSSEIVGPGGGRLLPANPREDEVLGALESLLDSPLARTAQRAASLLAWARLSDARRNYAELADELERLAGARATTRPPNPVRSNR